MSDLEASIRSFEKWQAEAKQERIKAARQMRDSMSYADEHLNILELAGVQSRAAHGA